MVKDAPPDGFLDAPPDGFADQPPDGFDAPAPTAGEPQTFPSKQIAALVAKFPSLGRIGNTLKTAVADVGSRPEMQPYTPDSFKPSQTGNPVEDALRMTREVYSFPLRSGSTLMLPQMMVQGKATEYLLNKGTDPYLAAAGGMVAGVIADPINAVAAAEIATGATQSFSKSRMDLKMDLVKADAVEASRMAEAAPKPSPEDLAVAQRVELKQREIDELTANSKFGHSDPTKFKEIGIPEGQPKQVTLRTAEGVEVPQYQPKMTNIKTGEDAVQMGRLEVPRLTAMEETRPNTGKVTFEDATLMPKENRILVPEGYEPTRPETREIPGIPGQPPEIIPVYGYKPYESLASEETAALPRPMSEVYAPQEQPAGFRQWMSAGVKELQDLQTSRELASPTADPHTDLGSTVRRYVGHQELARFDGAQMTNEFAGYVPDKARRTLITLYSKLGRAPTREEIALMQNRLSKVKSPNAKAVAKSLDDLLTHDLSLSATEQGALDSFNEYFQHIGNEAQNAGIIHRLKEIYGGPGVYEPRAEAEKGFMRKLVTGKTRFAKTRTFDTPMEAIDAGYIPKTLDSAELIGMYHNNIARAASERYLMDVLEKKGLINYAGDGNQIKGFQTKYLPIQNKATGSTDLYARQPYSTNPEVQRVMSRIAEDPVLDYPIVRAVERYNSFKKLALVYLQTFHTKALAAEAMGKGFSPARFRDGLEMINQAPEYVRGMIRSGLVVNTIPDAARDLAATAARDYKGANPIAFGRKINDIYSHWVFGKYMVGLKVYNANVTAKRLITMGIESGRAMELAVEDSNRIFGGLNLKLMHRSPNMQRLFHMLSFAPDWTESKARQMASVVGKGLGDVSQNEAKILAAESRAYWARMIGIASVTWAADQMNPANRLLSVDLSQESGFKDVKKVAKLLALDPTYFRTKMAPAPRDIIAMIDPRLRMSERFKYLIESSFPIGLQEKKAK